MEEYTRPDGKESGEQGPRCCKDKCSTLRAFLDDAPSNETVGERIISKIQSLFNEAATGMLTLCSIHRSKGGEWGRVFLMESGVLGDTTRKRNGKIQVIAQWELQQKRNLLYVAITRAQNELVFCGKSDVLQLA